MATYTDQFYLFDPANPPAAGTPVSFSRLDYDDVDNDGDIDSNGDTVNGQAVNTSYPGDTVTIDTGSGTITYVGVTFFTPGGGVYFTPTDGQVLQDGTLVSSTFVTTQGPFQVPNRGPSCFVAGTRIRTSHGMRPVEDIQVGDQVKTRDNGWQTVRWTAQSVARAAGAFAPVRFAEGTLGNTRPLMVSQQHRMLVRGPVAELHFGVTEVLVAAKHLVNGDDVVLVPGGTVTYLHLLFDRHEIVFAENAPCESFHPNDAIVGEDDEVMAELNALFPDLAARQTAGVWNMARPVVRGAEAAVLAR